MIEFYNEWHLGDNVFHLNFLRKLTKLTNDSFVYYVNPIYINELNKHIVGFEDKIQLKPIQEKTPQAMNAWIGGLYYNHPNKYLLDKFYIEWFNFLGFKLYKENFNLTMYSDYPELNKPTKEYELLIVNSDALSGQFDCSTILNDVIKELNEKYLIITTKKVEGVECTLDSSMSLVDIGALSTNCKGIIAINTGAISCCLNEWTIKNVKSWIIGDNRHSYSFNNITHVSNTNELIGKINEIYL